MISAALTAARRRHACAMARACPATVLLGGVTYANVAAMIQPGMLQNEDGGQRSANILTVTIAKSRLVTPPARLSKLTYEGQVWIIEEVAGTEAWAQEWILTARL